MIIKHNKKTGFALIEYAIVLGIAGTVLIGMNTYIKRGLQGRLKDMTDYFISNEQVDEIDPVQSGSGAVSNTEINSNRLIGGGTRSELSAANDTASTKIEFVREFFDPSPMITADEIEKGLPGAITPSDPKDFIDPDWENENNIEILAEDRDGLLREAEILEAHAPALEAQGVALMNSGYRMGCPKKKNRDDCEAARYNMINRGSAIINEASAMRTKAGELREEAGKVQEKINELNK